MTLLDTMRTAARNRVNFLRTRAALAKLPMETRLDLDIQDIDAAARRAVWG